MEQNNTYNENRWEELVLKVSKQFKVTADFDFMLFIIGLNERALVSGLTAVKRSGI